ncbi:MAG: LysE family translocator [Polaromonas sp.]|uniref:LysE family translocator n=1 Tax=Polaromonas sp. TaxID=1869339 RepID=UPI002734AFE0|nr:LysE family translocator [Polaromonas sp.]MDP3798216.1 LysE family translocator [Polaromonas sp.]
MSPELLPALCLFALVTSITPGPNNTMVLASGVNFGFARSLPHIAGISIGFGVMTVAAGLGLHSALQSVPQAYAAMRYLGAAYMLWLAWQLAYSGPMAAETAGAARPMGFFAAAAFQWVNPKAWVMALGAVTAYLPAQPSPAQLVAMTLIFCLINAPCVGLWAACGCALRRLLEKPLYLRIFNVSMAVALVASLYPLLRD